MSEDQPLPVEDKTLADPLLLQTLICPVTRGPLTYNKADQELISKKAGLAFPIREGVPIMLEDEARQLPDDQSA